MDHESNTRQIVLYTLLIVLLLAMLAACGFFLWKLFYTPATPEPEPAPVVEDPVVVEPEPEPEPEPEEPVEQEEAPEKELQSFGALRMEVDEEALETVSEDSGHLTLRPKGEGLPRLDAQPVDGAGLTEEQRSRLAVGLLQAYYADPPATADVSITQDPDFNTGYLLKAPAVGEVPAMSARVRLLPSGIKLWYVILIYPEGERVPSALTTAFESAEIA